MFPRPPFLKGKIDPCVTRRITKKRRNEIPF